jgi:PAS domain S-box-containing protein
MDTMVAVDEQQRIRLFNLAAKRLFGLSQVEAVGQSRARHVPETLSPYTRAAHLPFCRDGGY